MGPLKFFVFNDWTIVKCADHHRVSEFWVYKYHLWWVRGEHRKVFLKSLKEIWVDEWRGWWEGWCSQKVKEPPQGSMKPYQIVWYTQKHILEVGYSLHNRCVYTLYILVFLWWIGVSINEGLESESVHCSIWIHFEFDDFWGPVTRGCAWWKMPKTCGVFKPSAWQKSLHSEFATFSIGLSSRGLSAIESRQGLTFKCFFGGVMAQNGYGPHVLHPKSPSFTSENIFFESPKPFQPRWSLK